MVSLDEGTCRIPGVALGDERNRRIKNENKQNHKGRSYFNASRFIYWRRNEGQKDVQGQRRERNVHGNNKQLGFNA